MYNVEESKERISKVLDSFKIGHSDFTVTPGPTVTLFEFYPQIGVRMSKISNLKNEFASALRTTGVRVIAPTETGTVGIEVPNEERQNVSMMEMLWSDEYQNTDMELPLVIGRKVDNSIFMVDLAKMPHLLVAGATGMGKSVGLNVIISSLLNKRTPDELKLVLIDPKQVELSVYDAIEKPYLAHLAGYSPICTTPEDAKATLEAVIRLMEERYTMLKEAGVRNIQEYNDTTTERLPYYVVIIDEYGDLIMQGDRSMEKAICRIAQKARAVGIHMIISTQRPDTKIVTGSIKANFPTRIAFRTTTGTDSRVILDRIGAERLTCKGDMLFFDGKPENVRVQCAYISTDEVNETCKDLAAEYADCEETMLPQEETLKNGNLLPNGDRVVSLRNGLYEDEKGLYYLMSSGHKLYRTCY
jgi:S-DNA-T family DNA segregation ATPase FtsK/SpoIIIE